MENAELTNKFAVLFKKYRLRSEFESISHFADYMAQKGIVYEESLYSHWQKGSRMPKDRNLLLQLANVFVEQGGITSIEQVNELLSAAGQGYVTKAEQSLLFSNLHDGPPFLAPQLPQNLIIRAELTKKATEILESTKLLLLHGSAGNGKTTLAIELAYLLKDRFTDGVLWYRADTSSLFDILSLVAFSYGFDVSHITTLEARASYIRSYLASKQILYIFDNIDNSQDVSCLLPNSPKSAVIFTSKENSFPCIQLGNLLRLPSFTMAECRMLFEKGLGVEFTQKNEKQLNILTETIGFSPLAIQLVSKYIHVHSYSIEEIIDYIHSHDILTDLGYENRNLYISLDISFKKLPKKQSEILTSLAIFPGKDFPVEGVASANNLDVPTTKKYIKDLVDYSFVEHSTQNRFKLHPFVYSYLRPKVKGKTIVKRTAHYYCQHLQSMEKNIESFGLILHDQENILTILDQCYKNKFYEEFCYLYKEYTEYLISMGNWTNLLKLSLKAYKAVEKIHDIPLTIYFCSRNISWLYSWMGDIEKSLAFAKEGLRLAKIANDPFWIAFAQERLGKAYINQDNLDQAEQCLLQALSYFSSAHTPDREANILRYLGEIYLLRNNIQKSVEYLHKAQALCTSGSWKNTLWRLTVQGIVILSLALVEYTKRDYRKALILLNHSLEIQQKAFHYSSYRIWSIVFLGILYEKLSDQMNAEKYLLEAEIALRYSGDVKRSVTNYPSAVLLKDDLDVSPLLTKSTAIKKFVKMSTP